MFRSEGAGRSERLNRLLAGYLAFIGGYVNSVGVVLTGLYTSHVTGNVARAALDAAGGQLALALQASALFIAFFGGAFGAHLVLEWPSIRSLERRYAVTLVIEAVLLAAFMFTHWPALLSAAMGLQNSLVTRVSGAVVRTTHLTGVVTDLGIEAARWTRHWLANGERPSAAKSGLLATIAGTFALGALAGIALTLHLGTAALALPMVALVGFALRNA